MVSKIYAGLNNRYGQEILTTDFAKSGRNLNDDNIIVARSLLEIRSLPIAPSILSKLWKKLGSVDMVCIHYPFPLADIAIAAYPFKLPKVVVYWHAEIVSQKYLKIILKPFTRRMLSLADRIIVSSPEMVKHSDLLLRHKQKTVVIPFGIDPPIDSNEESNDSPSKAIELLAIGRHVPYKGYGNLIKAMSATDYHLTIVGDGPLLQEHQNLVNALNLKDQVKFITDADDQQLKQLLESCKALVFPSTMPSEAFGLVQIEAMSYGKPVINTMLASGVPWVARHMKEGLTVKPDDVFELQTAIIRLMTDHELFARLSAGALARYKARFTSAVFLASTDTCYRDLLA